MSSGFLSYLRIIGTKNKDITNLDLCPAAADVATGSSSVTRKFVTGRPVCRLYALFYCPVQNSLKAGPLPSRLLEYTLLYHFKG